MDREINLEVYIPEHLKTIKEFSVVSNAENPEFAFLSNKISNNLDNQFFMSCDKEGIMRYEKLLDILPQSTDTLSERIFRVSTKWTASLPYTHRMLINMLDNLIGVGEYLLQLDNSKYEIAVIIELTSKKSLIQVKELIRRVIPVNLGCSVSLRYNNYEKLKTFTYGMLESYRHKYIRNEVL
jgi:Uncharacterized protein conserved in bacteria (DUF2313).